VGQIAAELEMDAASAGATVRLPVLRAAARDGRVDDVRRWIAAGVEAKAIIRAQAAAGLVASARDLLRDAGLAPDAAPAPLLDDDRRARTIRETTAALLRAIDADGLDAQAVAATRASARRTGAGPVGLITSLLYRGSGRETRVADPRGYLLRWRDRGSTAPAVEVVRSALAEPLRAVPPSMRPVLAEAMDPAVLRRGLERAVDRAVNGVGPIEPPRSAWWRVLGLLQVLATAGIALSAAWVVVWILVRPATGSVDLPIVGPVPTPFATLVAFVLAGLVLARALGAHAGWVGRRWAGRVRERIGAAIAEELEGEALRPLDELDARRGTTWSLAAAIAGDCGP
jgi:hypothetical protein